MNLNTVTSVLRPGSADEITAWRDGYAWLAGGTWLFSEPQIATDTLIDLEQLSWLALEIVPEGLDIAATCRIAELYGFAAPPCWTAAPLIRFCCNALLASFKIWNAATVGGNICMSLPAGAMISLTVALDRLHPVATWRSAETSCSDRICNRQPHERAAVRGAAARDSLAGHSASQARGVSPVFPDPSRAVGGTVDRNPELGHGRPGTHGQRDDTTPSATSLRSFAICQDAEAGDRRTDSSRWLFQRCARNRSLQASPHLSLRRRYSGRVGQSVELRGD